MWAALGTEELKRDRKMHRERLRDTWLGPNFFWRQKQTVIHPVYDGPGSARRRGPGVRDCGRSPVGGLALSPGHNSILP